VNQRPQETGTETDPALEQARSQLQAAGFLNPSEAAIAGRVATLKRAEVSVARRKAERESSRAKHVQAVKGGQFRQWVTILYRSPFARELRLSGCGLLVGLLNYQVGRGFVFVSLAKLRENFGAGRGAVSTALDTAAGYGILARWRIERLSESDRDYIMGLGIYKKRGWLFRINEPTTWNWEKVGGVPKSVQQYLDSWQA
jgi:hypothetical protein